ncbi:MAG: hypothetical protein R3E01_04960 [Pirellulaceae bacterium]|nr:hypothetical protein [Planctomycetales bacterium]
MQRTFAGNIYQPIKITVAGCMAVILAELSYVPTQAHCTPLQIGVDNNRLVLTGLAADPNGYAPWIYTDPSEDCGLVPAPNDRLITDIPGMVITGVAIDSGLYLQPLSRTVITNGIAVTRILWYWDSVSERVTQAPTDEPLLLRSQNGFGAISLPNGNLPEPQPLQLAAPTSLDLGQHRHLLRYQFDNSPELFPGAFGFFAQLTSPNYAASDPLLIMINTTLSAEKLALATQDINSIPLVGDFDGTGQYDCEDANLLSSAIVTHDDSGQFDLNADGVLTTSDLDTWLSLAGAALSPDGTPLLRGDANLDGFVDDIDFAIWNMHKYTSGALWCQGDFNADGAIDARDFAWWNSNRSSADSMQLTVPEPRGALLAAITLLIMTVSRRP